MKKIFHNSLMVILIISCQGIDKEKNNDKGLKNNFLLIEYQRGKNIYNSYCQSCHGYSISGTYYQPSLDSMYVLLKKSKFIFNYKSKSHKFLLQNRDSIFNDDLIYYITYWRRMKILNVN